MRPVGLDKLTPFQRACRDAIVAAGIPAVADFNDLSQDTGVAPVPVSVDGGTRINSAFGYIDPVRDRLVVAGDSLVEQVLVRGGRAAGVAVRDGSRLVEIGASRVVLSAGVYGSPAILLRSGIGPADHLRAVGIEPVLDLPGVGRNLHDQPCVEIWYRGSGELIEAMEQHRAETGWRPDEQVIAKYPSASCRQGFDMHVYPVGGYSKDASAWYWFLGAACLTPLSRGTVRLTGPDPGDRLAIDHRYLSDPGGYDRARLAEGVERVREVAAAPELRRLLRRETRPGPDISDRQAIERFGGTDRGENPLARRDHHAADGHVLGGEPVVRVVHRVGEPEQLLDSRREQRRVLPQPGHLPGVGQQRQGAGGDQVDGGVEARHDQQEDSGKELVAGQPVRGAAPSLSRARASADTRSSPGSARLAAISSVK